MVVGGVLVALFVVVVVVVGEQKAHRSMERKVQYHQRLCVCVLVCLRKEEVYRKSAFKSEEEKKVSKALPLSFQNFRLVKKTETKAVLLGFKVFVSMWKKRKKKSMCVFREKAAPLVFLFCSPRRTKRL